MRATLDNDIIVSLHAGETDIGELPEGVGIERLRWDGQKLVDLADMTEMWVEPVNGTYRLHAVEVPGSALVPMSYNQRKLLKLNSGSPRIKTEFEIISDSEAEKVRQAQADLDRSQSERIGDLSQRVLTLYKLLFALLVWARTKNAAIEEFLDELVPIVKDIFPKEKFAAQVKSDVAELKIIMDKHYAKEIPKEET